MSGLVVRLDPPPLETRIAILLRKAQSRGFELPAEVAEFIAATFMDDLRKMEGALSKVLNASSLTGMPMTLENVRASLDDLIDDPERRGLITVSDIIQAVQEYFHLTRKELLSRSKTRSLAYARQTGMYLTRKLTPLPLKQIGRHFGGRDHTTVIYAVSRIAELKNSRTEVGACLLALEHCIASRRGR